MAERRMFAKTIIDSDAFLDMPLSTQALYFHLSMRADDEGFINNPKKIMRMISASNNDIDILIAKKFIIPFDSGIVVIKHWKIHNYIRGDRITATKYEDEKALLSVKDNGAYTLNNVRQLSDKCQTDDGQMPDKCQYRLGKDRLGKDSVVERRFRAPSIEEVKAYCSERNNHVNAEQFVSFYESKGWKIGNQQMKDWKAAVRTWEQREKPKRNFAEREVKDEDFADLFLKL